MTALKTAIRIFTCVLIFSAPACGIDLKEAVTIGGIQQWIMVKGDPADPLLLFLHGGPGNSVMGYANRFTNDLGKKFLIVHWDQRQSGKTVELNASPQPLTVNLLVTDAVELIEHLRKRFNKEKIFLMGQSWGGFLSLEVAGAAPHLLQACLSVSPMIFQDESEKRSLAAMKAWAHERHDSIATRELNDVHVPFETWKDLYLHRKWLAVFDGRTSPSEEAVATWSDTWFSLFGEASHIDVRTQYPELKCPVYFFVGAKDFQTHFDLTREYYERVKAPAKKIFWFHLSSHSPHMKESQAFQKSVLSVLKEQS